MRRFPAKPRALGLGGERRSPSAQTAPPRPGASRRGDDVSAGSIVSGVFTGVFLVRGWGGLKENQRESQNHVVVPLYGCLKKASSQFVFLNAAGVPFSWVPVWGGGFLEKTKGTTQRCQSKGVHFTASRSWLGACFVQEKDV